MTTIERLARMMQAEFLGVDRRFDAADKRFESVDKRFDAADKRFDSLEARVETVETVVRDMKDNFGELFTKLDAFISMYRDTSRNLRSSPGTLDD